MTFPELPGRAQTPGAGGPLDFNHAQPRRGGRGVGESQRSVQILEHAHIQTFPRETRGQRPKRFVAHAFDVPNQRVNNSPIVAFSPAGALQHAPMLDADPDDLIDDRFRLYGLFPRAIRRSIHLVCPPRGNAQ